MNGDLPAARLAALAGVVAACRRCPAMAGRRRVLGTANGPPRARVLLVGEAPGRLGADRTGIPFSGDASGRRLDRLLEASGWSRRELFITNAVLCNPRDDHGRNRPPTSLELTNCRDHLAATLELVSPLLVVALGRRASAALGALHPHALAQAEPGALEPWSHPSVPWIAWVLHPSPCTQTHRPFAAQAADWRRLHHEFATLAEPHATVRPWCPSFTTSH
jgi:uracil-DNA glycosylase family 4